MIPAEAPAPFEKEKAPPGEPAMSQRVQRAVNAARRAGVRKKKAEEDLQTCKLQWESCSRTMRQTFLQQQAEYLEDLKSVLLDSYDGIEEVSDKDIGDSNLAGGLPIAKTARGMQQLVEHTQGVSVVYKYVKAHNGAAWNELADVGAKIGTGIFGDSLQRSIRRPSCSVAFLIRLCNWDWAWMTPYTVHDAMGTYIQNGQILWCETSTTSSIQPGNKGAAMASTCLAGKKAGGTP